MRTLIIASALAVGALVACDDPGPELPIGSVEFAPPAIYRRWWAMIEGCAGTTRSMNAVRWYRVKAGTFRSPAGQLVDGYFQYPANIIVLADTASTVGATVRHEMLHAVTLAPNHVRDKFLGACASLVDCNTACAKDSEAWVAPGPWTAMVADSLVVSAVATVQPAETDGERYLAIRVKARNPKGSAIYATHPTNQRFQFALVLPANAGGAGVHDEVYASDSSSFYFAPNETKEFLFELRITNTFTRSTVPQGRYSYWGAFKLRYSAMDSVLIAP